MPKQAYLNKRKELQEKAQALINDNKAKEADEVMNEIKALDEAFEAQTKAQANLNALNRNTVIDIQNAGVNLNNAKVMDKTNAENITDEAEVYKNAFAKTLMKQTLDNKEQEVFDKINTVQNELQTTKQNGIVVPNTLMENIFKNVAESHPILNDLYNFGVKGDLSLLAEKSNQTDDTDKDLWVDEDTEGSEEGNANLEKITLSGCELTRGTLVSWKLKKMSIDAYLKYVIDKISEKIGNALAYGVLRGKGRPSSDDDFKEQPLGIISKLEKTTNTPKVIEYKDGDDLEEKIRNLISLVKGGYKQKACLYANSDFIWNTLAGIKDKNGRAYFITDYESGGVGRIFGIIVKEEDAMPDNTLLLGAVKDCYAYNINEDMSITQEDKTKKRHTYYQAYMLVDGAVLTDEGFAVLKKA